ncbi:polygalacturonate 4-alpha-galacturonosyltransferase isoform X2 [Selaginella moellendorffii]|uniref:polygalacturonate 4-alpha-galacturonosyltransferase isoform X2 n=1 Tax=Selaginella moellendorffii TaxID=88036 RepID=UPI000D1CFF45|nr:polygalacturonate 4-alpha-galacturonosyltransferase isoform X2 [Selaginella moellendorffii]|eukprot:XP_024530024.1 polygalacturonate 4-alpha-galacturonosyltransferase isoform X2 [Selaginella moellendorffii]
MRSKRGPAAGPQHRVRNDKFRISVGVLLAVSMIAPLIFLAPRIAIFSTSFGKSELPQTSNDDSRNGQKASVADQVLDVIIANSEESHSSSLVRENSEKEVAKKENVVEDVKTAEAEDQGKVVVNPNLPHGEDVNTTVATADESSQVKTDPAAEIRKQDEGEKARLEEEAIKRSKAVDGAILGKYSIWRRDENENSDSLVRLIRDQVIMARAYIGVAQARNNQRLLRDLRIRLRDSERVVGDATIDAELPRSAPDKIRAMGQVLAKARQQNYDCNSLVKGLRAMLHGAEDYARSLRKQSAFLSQLAAKTMPKGLHCLSLRLNVQYHVLPPDERQFPNREKLEDDDLYHYALFSDNVLAAAVVVNSTVLHAEEPDKHVFHLVTDRLNFGAMKMWFLDNPPGNATIHVQNIDDFTWLNSSYCPVLRQLESAAMKDYYFKPDQTTSVTSGTSNLKYRNPKYLSMLNHLRFYLPEVFPGLSKILFLDDDIVVQKDLTPLWSVDLHGKVNGAVETCGASFHRFDKYLNFSNPHIARNFDPNACGWAYGMNIFDLEEWKKRDITGIYHKWQTMNKDRTLWKLGTLPPGLITFYNLTYPLDKSWHVLGLGYNPGVEPEDIDAAAVVHYNGNLKPWLEIGLSRFKGYWSRYVKYDHPYLQECNIQ